MAPLAQAYVRLRPQLSEAEVRASATRAGEQAGVAMGRGMSSGLTRTFKAFAGLGAATGLVEAGRKVLQFADQFEGARARVQTNTENIGTSFKDVQKPLGDLDTKMSTLGFTITDTENAFAQLITATRNPAKALRDVALAADIARGRHVSLDTATQILMRVETGHVAMLGRLGIATRDASGHIFTQAQALDALAKAYGGNAARFAGTFAGKQAAARAEIQQSATEIGVALLPALADLAGVLAHDVLPPIAEAARWFDRNRKTIEPLTKALLIGVAAWKSYVLWTRVAAASNALFARSAIGAAAGAAGAAGAARLATGAAVTGSAGAVIGGGMASGLTGANVTLANSALLAARNVGLMGLSALGIVNFIKNPRSLGFPMGFNHELGVGREKTSGVVFFDKQGNKFSDPDLKKPIVDTKALTTATQALTGAESVLGTTMQRTVAQMAAHAQHAIALRSAQDGLRQAMHDAAQTAVDSGKALVGNSDAALANRAAVTSQVTAIFSVIQAMQARHASDAQQASALAILTAAVEQNAIKLYGDKAAVDSLLASLGLLPGAANAAAQALASLPISTQSQLTSGDISRTGTAVKDFTDTLAQNKDKGQKVAASFNSGFTPVVAKGAASAAKTAANKFADVMKNDLQTIRDSIASTESTLAGFAAFQTSGTDTLGASGAETDFIGQKREKAAQLEQFANLYGRLVKSGLNPDDLHEFVGLGPAAIPAMQALLAAGRTGIRQENAINRRINAADSRVATADAASQNLALIHRDLQTLPTKFERGFVRALERLHIVTDIKAIDHANGKRILS